MKLSNTLSTRGEIGTTKVGDEQLLLHSFGGMPRRNDELTMIEPIGFYNSNLIEPKSLNGTLVVVWHGMASLDLYHYFAYQWRIIWTENVLSLIPCMTCTKVFLQVQKYLK